jgi:hypothetical protein
MKLRMVGQSGAAFDQNSIEISSLRNIGSGSAWLIAWYCSSVKTVDKFCSGDREQDWITNLCKHSSVPARRGGFLLISGKILDHDRT